jgi:hypothetical protein
VQQRAEDAWAHAQRRLPSAGGLRQCCPLQWWPLQSCPLLRSAAPCCAALLPAALPGQQCGWVGADHQAALESQHGGLVALLVVGQQRCHRHAGLQAWGGECANPGVRAWGNGGRQPQAQEQAARTRTELGAPGRTAPTRPGRAAAPACAPRRLPPRSCLAASPAGTAPGPHSCRSCRRPRPAGTSWSRQPGRAAARGRSTAGRARPGRGSRSIGAPAMPREPLVACRQPLMRGREACWGAGVAEQAAPGHAPAPCWGLPSSGSTGSGARRPAATPGVCPAPRRPARGWPAPSAALRGPGSLPAAAAAAAPQRSARVPGRGRGRPARLLAGRQTGTPAGRCRREQTAAAAGRQGGPRGGTRRRVSLSSGAGQQRVPHLGGGCSVAPQNTLLPAGRTVRLLALKSRSRAGGAARRPQASSTASWQHVGGSGWKAEHAACAATAARSSWCVVPTSPVAVPASLSLHARAVSRPGSWEHNASWAAWANAA